MLELGDGARERIHGLQELADRAEADPDDRAALAELRRELRESAPEVVARCADTVRTYRRVLARSASGGDALVEEAIVERARRLAGEVAGDEGSSPLEALLAERVASLWVLVELLEALVSAWFSRHNDNRASAPFLLKLVRIQESANRRYLAAIKTLAQVRKLQANTPSVQFNTQINLAGAPDPRNTAARSPSKDQRATG